MKPNGYPVYRALSAYVVALRAGKHVPFLKSFAYHVWCCGVDAGTNVGLRCITDAAGLSWEEVLRAVTPSVHGIPETESCSGVVDSAIESEWRAITRHDMNLLGASDWWGVPCVQYKKECSEEGGLVLWGQDKLYILEECLKNELQDSKNKANNDVMKVLNEHFHNF